MPWKSTKARARRDKAAGKSASTQAGEYVKEQAHKAKRGKGRAKSRKQAVAIGLSQARRAGVKVPARKKAGAKRSAKRTTRSSGRSRTKRT
ncbi:MAG TPA: DUF6496 domain-containing protein [Anaeromyxobacteraceae bacterium]